MDNVNYPLMGVRLILILINFEIMILIIIIEMISESLKQDTYSYIIFTIFLGIIFVFIPYIEFSTAKFTISYSFMVDLFLSI